MTETTIGFQALEALWWVDDPGQQRIMAAVAAGEATILRQPVGSRQE